ALRTAHALCAAASGSGLTVVPGDVVVECVHGRVPLECGVASVMVVVVEEAGKGGAAFGVAGVGGGPGPLVFEGEVEPLDLAVGLRPVRPRALVLDPGVSRGLAEVLGAV